MPQPLISIIIPSYNRAAIITETLDSVLAQTYTNWECIVVDDGSTDETTSVLKSYSEKDSRFQDFTRPIQKSKGPSSCRNYGLEKAKGEYVIFLDSDDLLAPFCLENRVEKFQEYLDCDFLVFQMERFLKEPDFSKRTKKPEQNKNRVLESFLHLHGEWPITAPIYKINFFKKIGFNQELVVFEDLEVAIKAIVFASHFHILETIDCYYRNDENYKTKYNSLDVKTKMVQGFKVFVLSLVDIMQQNSEDQFRNSAIKSYLVQSYKKIFRFYILENSIIFKCENKRIVQLLATHSFLNNKNAFKFFFVDIILLPFVTLKGSGISKLIKFIYK